MAKISSTFLSLYFFVTFAFHENCLGFHSGDLGFRGGVNRFDTNWKSGFDSSGFHHSGKFGAKWDDFKPGKDDVVIGNSVGGVIPSISTNGDICIGCGGGNTNGVGETNQPERVEGVTIKGAKKHQAGPPAIPKHTLATHHHRHTGQTEPSERHHPKKTHTVTTNVEYSVKVHRQLCPHKKHGKCSGTNVHVSWAVVAVLAISAIWYGSDSF